MGVEIERKFLVVGDSWRDDVVSATRIVQGYLSSGGSATVRARIKGERAYPHDQGAEPGHQSQ